jgi:hypothetical protein
MFPHTPHIAGRALRRGTRDRIDAMIVRSCLSRGRRIAATLGLALMAASTAVAATTPPPEPLTPFDAGTFRVYQKDQYLGTEDFWMAQTPDSFIVRAYATQVLPRPGSPPVRSRNTPSCSWRPRTTRSAPTCRSK